MKWLSLAEAAERVPYSRQTLERAARATEEGPGLLPPLPARKTRAGRWVITDEELDEWMRSQLD